MTAESTHNPLVTINAWALEERGYLTPSEVRCSCAQCRMGSDTGFPPETEYTYSVRLFANLLRHIHKAPLSFTSVYRCPEHPIEKKKANPGAHAQGKAIDIARTPTLPEKLLIALGIWQEAAPIKARLVKAIGIADSFIHVDFGHDYANRPGFWYYAGVNKTPFEKAYRELILANRFGNKR